MKQNPRSVLYESLKLYLQGSPENWKDYAPIRSIYFTKIEKEWLKEHPEVRIGIDKAFAPFEYITQNNEYTGVSADYLDLISKKLGIKFALHDADLPWNETVKKAKKT
jgi:ABC-type amino acid transport substrate-binding protein